MGKTKMNKEMKTVFDALYEFLGLYEETDCYNKAPKGEEVDIEVYRDQKFLEIYKTVETLFGGDVDIAKKLHRIVDETERFVKKYEVPGTASRWNELNPNLLFYDVAFDLYEESPELLNWEGVTFRIYPNEELLAQRKEYFEKIRNTTEKENLQYSDSRIFQNELLRTLRIVFEHDFALG